MPSKKYTTAAVTLEKKEKTFTFDNKKIASAKEGGFFHTTAGTRRALSGYKTVFNNKNTEDSVYALRERLFAPSKKELKQKLIEANYDRDIKDVMDEDTNLLTKANFENKRFISEYVDPIIEEDKNIKDAKNEEKDKNRATSDDLPYIFGHFYDENNKKKTLKLAKKKDTGTSSRTRVTLWNRIQSVLKEPKNDKGQGKTVFIDDSGASSYKTSKTFDGKYAIAALRFVANDRDQLKRALKSLLDEGHIDQDEFDEYKRSIIDGAKYEPNEAYSKREKSNLEKNKSQKDKVKSLPLKKKKKEESSDDESDEESDNDKRSKKSTKSSKDVKKSQKKQINSDSDESSEDEHIHARPFSKGKSRDSRTKVTGNVKESDDESDEDVRPRKQTTSKRREVESSDEEDNEEVKLKHETKSSSGRSASNRPARRSSERIGSSSK